jgi:hypothetical protein
MDGRTEKATLNESHRFLPNTPKIIEVIDLSLPMRRRERVIQLTSQTLFHSNYMANSLAVNL